MNPPPATKNPASRLWTRRAWLGSSLAALALMGLGNAGCSRIFHRALNPGSNGRVRVLAWSDYFATVDEIPDEHGIVVPTPGPEEIIGQFESETGIAVELALFSSPNQLAQLLLAEDASYDLAMIPGFAAKRLHASGWLHRIPRRLVPNAKNIDWKRFKFAFDPHCEFAIPYIWGSSGIAYNIDFVPRLPKRWSDLLREMRDLSGEKVPVGFADDGRFVLVVALIALGVQPHTATSADIQAAGNLITSMRNRVTLIKRGQMVKGLEEESIHLALSTSGEVTKAMRRNKNVRLALPPEGSLVFRDTFVMPLTAAEKRKIESGRRIETEVRHENAFRFLDYLLRPEVAGNVTNYSCFATTLPAARPYVHRWITNGAAYFINPHGKDLFLEEFEDTESALEKAWPSVRQLLA